MSNKNSKIQMSLTRKIDWYFSLMIRVIIMEWALGWNTIILKKKKKKKKKKEKKKKTIFMMGIKPIFVLTFLHDSHFGP